MTNLGAFFASVFGWVGGSIACRRVRSAGLVGSDRLDGKPTQQQRALRESWEVVVPELIY